MPPRNRGPKAANLRVTQEFLDARTERSIKAGFRKQKWIIFCEALLADGFHVSLYEAKTTVSKYITARRGKRSYKVRFSNHKPNKGKELEGDSDFFVGMTHTGTRTTDDALRAVRAHFAKETT